MDGNHYERVRACRIAIALAREMRSDGIVSEKDYGIICTALADYFGLSLSSIFAENDLLYRKDNANI